MQLASLPKQKMLLFFWIFLFIAVSGFGQSYHAIHGSSYTGATSIFNNPASPVNSSKKWDLNLFAFQLGNSTNSLVINGAEFPPLTAYSINLTKGSQRRWLHQNMDINLMNAMYKLSDKHSISVGLRMRTYNHIHTEPVHLRETFTTLRDFLIDNRSLPGLQGTMTHSFWAEGDINYSRVLQENNAGKLSGGITLQIMKNISGGYVKINKLMAKEYILPTDTIYGIADGYGSYAYSANYDETLVGTNTQSNSNSLLKNAKKSVGISLGIEYLVYDQESDVSEGETKPYSWKFGASLMDIGSNNFNTGTYTGQFSQPKTALNNWDIENKLMGITASNELKDSLATMFNSVKALPATFKIGSPTRLTLNVDRNLGNHFYINGGISLNLKSTSKFTKQNLREFNLITVTPRWETLLFGLYLPVQYNSQGQLWAGAAVKLGPLVAGIHNLGIFKKEPSLSGGGYIMFSIYPIKKSRIRTRLDCRE